MLVPVATSEYVGVVTARSSHANPSARSRVHVRTLGVGTGVIDWMYP